MFNFLKRKVSLADSGILKGMTDYHSHLLPGVDDGVKTMAETLEILEEMEKQGIREVWFTPHIMEDIPNKTADLKEKFTEVQAAYQGNIKLHLAAENMLDNLFEERLERMIYYPLRKMASAIFWWRLLISIPRWTCTTFLNGFSRKDITHYLPIRSGMST